jgi:hypothetical protein
MFAMEQGSLAYVVMAFGLKNAPAIFSGIVVVTFMDFIQKFQGVPI